MTAVLVAITLVKLVLASFWGHTADIPQIFLQAKAFLAGADVLDPSRTGGNPSFFLLGHYLLASLCLSISQLTGISFRSTNQRGE